MPSAQLLSIKRFNFSIIQSEITVIRAKVNVTYVEQFLIVRPDVQNDGETVAGVDTSQSRIKREFSNRNTHTIGTQVPETENTLTISYHYSLKKKHLFIFRGQNRIADRSEKASDKLTRHARIMMAPNMLTCG